MENIFIKWYNSKTKSLVTLYKDIGLISKCCTSKSKSSLLNKEKNDTSLPYTKN